MHSIGYLTARHLTNPRRSGSEHDLQFRALQPACALRGYDLVEVSWDESSIEVDAFAAFIVATTWDYTHRPEEFLGALETFAARRPLFNPLPLIRWNLSKSYLDDLATREVPVVETLFRDVASEITLADAFETLDSNEIVVKPLVGASSWRQSRLRRGEPLPAPEDLPIGACLIQPFLPSITSEGEVSALYFNRTFSHAVRKVPRSGDYRIQAQFGGREVPHILTSEEDATARKVLDALDDPLLHCRVDLVHGRDGGVAVMEVEVIEPYLYPEQGPNLGQVFARALDELLRS